MIFFNHRFQFAKVILGRTYFESGDFRRAFELVQRLRFSNKDIADGYSRVLFLQARVMKGKRMGLLFTC